MKALLTAAVILLSGATAYAEKPGEEAQKLIRKLGRDKDADARSLAAQRLGLLKAVEAVPALATALRDKDPGVRANAAGALLEIGEPAKDAMPALQEALLDSNSFTVWNAAAALHRMGVVTTDLMPAYRRLLQDPDCDMKVSAANAIREYAPPADLLPIALECRSSREHEVEKGVRKLMASIAQDRAAVPLIAERLREDGDAEVREWAAKALGDLGRAARAGIPALQKAMTDEVQAVREAAARALERIEPRR
jgi:HEAT repeat protein